MQLESRTRTLLLFCGTSELCFSVRCLCVPDSPRPPRLAADLCHAEMCQGSVLSMTLSPPPCPPATAAAMRASRQPSDAGHAARHAAILRAVRRAQPMSKFTHSAHQRVGTSCWCTLGPWMARSDDRRRRRATCCRLDSLESAHSSPSRLCSSPPASRAPLDEASGE